MGWLPQPTQPSSDLCSHALHLPASLAPSFYLSMHKPSSKEKCCLFHKVLKGSPEKGASSLPELLALDLPKDKNHFNQKSGYLDRGGRAVLD